MLDCRVPIERVQALLCDISETGCRIELFDAHVNDGATILFEIDGEASFAGQIVWVRGIEAGVRFTHKLSGKVRHFLEL